MPRSSATAASCEKRPIPLIGTAATAELAHAGTKYT